MAEGRRFSTAARFGGIVFLVAILAGGGLYGFLHTRAGLDFAAERIASALSDDTTMVRISGLRGLASASIRIGKITVSDRRGVYAVAEDTRLAWHPMALFRRTVDIETLSINRLSLARLPQREPAPASAPTAAFPAVNFRAGKIAIDEISLASPVLGEAQKLSGVASARLDANLSKAALELTLRRIDGGRDRAEVKFDYAAHPARFMARVHVEEPRGGMLAALAGLPRNVPLRVALTGDGPPDAWRGTLKVDGGKVIAGSSVIRIALGDSSVGIAMDGAVKSDGLLPPQLRPLLVPLVRFQATADFSPSQGLSVTRLSAQSDALTLSASGRYGIVNDDISAMLTVKSRGDRPLTDVLAGVSISRAMVEARVTGSLAKPELRLSFATGPVSGGPARAAGAKGSIALVPVSPKEIEMTGAANFAGLDLGDAVPRGIFGRALSLNFAGIVGRDAAVPRMEITVASGPARFELIGQLDGQGRASGGYTFRLADIEAAARSAGMALKGNFLAEGTLRADLGSRSVHVTTSGGLGNLAGGALWTAPLLGKHIPFAGTIDWRDGTPLKISGLKITPAMGSLEVEAVLDLDTAEISATAKAVVPDLNSLSPLAGQKLAGRMTANAELTGPLAVAGIRGQALITGLGVNEAVVGTIGTGFAAWREGQALKASLRLGGVLRTKKLSGTLNAGFSGGSIEVSDIDLSVGKNRVSGSLGFDAAGKGLTGALSATLADIGDLPGADGVGIAGSGEIRVAAGSQRPGRIDVTAQLRNLRRTDADASRAAIQRISARLQVSDALTNPALSGEMDFDYVLAAGARSGHGKARISGTPSEIEWSASAGVPDPSPASFSTNGSVALTENQVRLLVKKLDGIIDGQRLALKAPFAVTREEDGWRVGSIDLSLPEGRIRLSASFGGKEFDVTGEIEGLPLRLGSWIDRRISIDGILNAKLHASGPLGRPEIALTLAARDIRPLDMEGTKLAGLNATLDLRQVGDSVQVNARLTGQEGISLVAELKTRALVDLWAPSFSVPADLPLNGALEATGRLGPFAEVVGLGEDSLAGSVKARIKIAGTLGQPDIHGEIALSGGSYESAATGTILRDVAGRLAFRGDHARLVSLAAGDGESGRLSGVGTFRLRGPSAASDGIAVTFQKFTALRHPSAEFQATGSVNLSGSLDSPRVTGRLRVDRGELRIPDEFPEEIVELDVVEINGPGVAESPSRVSRKSAAGKTFAAALELALEFPNRTFVRGRGLDSEWKGNLMISGTTAAPVVAGKLEALRGTFAFAGKTFIVKRGSVFLPSAAAAEPEINAMAEAKLKGLLARVEISGTVSKPSFTISSDPPLPQEDVLAHILFGRTTGQLTAIQAAQLAQTAATLSGRGGGPGIVDRIRQALGVDVLNVDSQGDNGGGASLKAGKYLTEDVFLSVTQGTQPGSQKVGVEVEVLPNVTIDSSVSGTADSNIGVNWKWDY